MKNFTTIEQSKRLMELGVPSDSADCYIYPLIEDKEPWVYIRHDESFWMEGESIPCWSVGRLIEIYEICFGGYFNSRYFGHTLMEDVLLKIEEQIDSMDFSKLEK